MLAIEANFGAVVAMYIYYMARHIFEVVTLCHLGFLEPQSLH